MRLKIIPLFISIAVWATPIDPIDPTPKSSASNELDGYLSTSGSVASNNSNPLESENELLKQSNWVDIVPQEEEIFIEDLSGELEGSVQVDLSSLLMASLSGNYTDKLLLEASTYLGTPYVYGGSSRRGIDCSAFTQNVFKSNDINLPRTARDQYFSTQGIELHDAKRGDLLFFSTYTSGPSHVGIVHEVLEDGDIIFIHASSSKGVTYSKLSESYWSKRFIKAKRAIKIEEEINLSYHQ